MNRLVTIRNKQESTGIAIDRLNFTYVRSIYYTASTRKQEVIPDNYFFEADKYQFNNDKFLSFREYRNAIYGKYITSKATNSKDDLEKTYNLIETKLKGKTRDHALIYLAGQYTVKRSAADSQMLRKIFNSLYAKKLDSNSVQYLKNRERKYYKIDKPLPESILNNTILVNYSDSKQINLKQLLDAYKGKAVYIDLWASWCGACRADIAESSEVKKMLIESGVSYLYISSDKDKEAWKKASVQDKITTDQYKFEYGKDKEFNDFIELFSIPRYIILDKNHHVKNLFAPRPTSSYAGELRRIIQELSANSK